MSARNISLRLLPCTVVLSLGIASCARPDEPLNLVFVSLDTVRRDHLATYGYPRDTSPSIDALADQALVFDNVVAQDTNTNPSHTSMFTGVYPRDHGSRKNGEQLAPDQVTLAQILQAAGIRTGGFVSAVTMHERTTGLERGFDVYDDEFSESRREGGITTELALDWLRGIEEGQRYFLFLHLFDAHGPYKPQGRYTDLFVSQDPGPVVERIPGYQRVADSEGRYRNELNWFVDRYDGAIRYTDHLVGKVLAEVNAENTIVVVISDHGETLGERYWALDHGAQVFDEQIRIPLILRVPGLEHRRVGAAVETVDLLPTLLELMGVKIPHDRPVRGSSLLPLIRGERSSLREFSFSSARTEERRHVDRGYELNGKRWTNAVRSARFKLIQYPGFGIDYLELYDLENDPWERDNVVRRFPEVRDAHLQVLRDWASEEDDGPTPTPLDPELQEKLESLGYVGG